jgi:cell division protein FtsB
MKEFKYDFKNRGSKKQSKRNIMTIFIDSGLVKVALIVLSVLLLLSVYRSLRHTIDRVNLLKQAENEVSMLRLENLRLSLRIVDSSSEEYLEKEARNKLNYSKENEIMFVIPEDLIEDAKERLDLIYEEKEETISREEVFAKWVEFVVEGY